MRKAAWILLILLATTEVFAQSLIGAQLYGSSDSDEERGVRLISTGIDQSVVVEVLGTVSLSSSGVWQGGPELRQSTEADRVNLGQLQLRDGERVIGAATFGLPADTEPYGADLVTLRQDGSVALAQVGMIDPSTEGFSRGDPQLTATDPSARTDVGRITLEPTDREFYGAHLAILRDGRHVTQAVVGMVDSNTSSFSRGYPQLVASDTRARLQLGDIELEPEEKIIGAEFFGTFESQEAYGVRLVILKPGQEIATATVGMVDPNTSGVVRGYPELEASDPRVREPIVDLSKFSPEICRLAFVPNAGRAG